MDSTLPAEQPTPALTQLFRWRPCLAGIALLTVGAGVLAYWLLFHAAGSWIAFGVAGLVMLGGTGLVCTSRMEVCAGCRDELVGTHTTLSLEVQEQVRVAVLATKTGDLDWVLLLQELPLAPRHARLMATLELEYCPTCRLVGKLSSGQRRRTEGGSMSRCEVSPPVVISGPQLVRVLEVISIRNMARTRAIYGNSQ